MTQASKLGAKATKAAATKTAETATSPELTYAQKLKNLKEIMQPTMPNASPKDIDAKARKYLADMTKDENNEKERRESKFSILS